MKKKIAAHRLSLSRETLTNLSNSLIRGGYTGHYSEPAGNSNGTVCVYVDTCQTCYYTCYCEPSYEVTCQPPIY